MTTTLFDKIWHPHVVKAFDDGTALIYVDRVFVHERTGSIALGSLNERDIPVKHPEHVFATMDHIIDTFPGRGDETMMPGGEAFIRSLRKYATDASLTLFDIHDRNHGITHIIAAEQGIALPGLIVACPDSHTCTLGGLAAIGWGIGTSDCEHVLATQTLRAAKPQQMRVEFEGELGNGVTAKDIILHLIGTFGASGARGHAVEFCGEAIKMLDIEARFTLCNMAVEFSAFTGLVAPDEKTLAYVADKHYTPRDAAWERAVSYWKTLRSDEGAQFDKTLRVNCADIAPTVTWGTSPEHAVPITGLVPQLDSDVDAETREQLQSAMNYMGLSPGQSLDGLPINGAFIGSCTNARLSDLRAAARILDGQTVADGVRAICTPGSRQIKLAAEAEGIDDVFKKAGFEWREPGCSLCFNAGGESFGPKERVMTSTNRNFRGRQGSQTRSHLASPASVAAAAIAGHITDVRAVTRH
ncbi:MAG: 3-isopropylmalate dehydratase large subunit [Pseudomonadota bacterium]